MRSPRMAEEALMLVLMAGSMIALTPSPLLAVKAAEDDLPGPAASDRPNTIPAYPHGKVIRFELGEGPRSYWLFEPADPRPERSSVVVFFHGWFAVNPAFYGAWIDHLVRSGRTVIFPRYQNDVGTLPKEFLPNAIA